MSEYLALAEPWRAADFAMLPAAPDLRPLPTTFRQNGGRPFHRVPLAEGLKNYVATCEPSGSASEPLASVETVNCPVDHGNIALLLHPGMGVSAFKHSQVILFIHGGVWVTGELDSHGALCTIVARRWRTERSKPRAGGWTVSVRSGTS